MCCYFELHCCTAQLMPSMPFQGANTTSPSGSRGRGRGRGRGWSAASRKARWGGVPTLQDLIEAGIIIPGRNNITVSYKGTTYTASLEKDGSIAYQGSLQAPQGSMVPLPYTSTAWKDHSMVCFVGGLWWV